MNFTPRVSEDDYTPEEMIVLAKARRDSGRTCRCCAWYVARGTQKGCFPDGKYRKWLGPEEFDSGCYRFQGRDAKPSNEPPKGKSEPART